MLLDLKVSNSRVNVRRYGQKQTETMEFEHFLHELSKEINSKSGKK